MHDRCSSRYTCIALATLLFYIDLRRECFRKRTTGGTICMHGIARPFDRLTAPPLTYPRTMSKLEEDVDARSTYCSFHAWSTAQWRAVLARACSCIGSVDATTAGKLALHRWMRQNRPCSQTRQGGRKVPRYCTRGRHTRSVKVLAKCQLSSSWQHVQHRRSRRWSTAP